MDIIKQSATQIGKLHVNAERIHKYAPQLAHSVTVVEPAAFYPRRWYVAQLYTNPDTGIREPIFAHGIYETKEEADAVALTLRDLCDMVSSDPSVPRDK